MMFARFFIRAQGTIDKADFWLFEFSVWLHVIARSIVSVFIPFILLKSGFTIPEIIIYYTIFYAIDVPLNFITPPLIRRFGARIVFALSAIFAIGFFTILSFVRPDNWLVLVTLAFFAAMYDVLYWNSHLFLFIKSNQENRKTDRNVGVLFSVKQVALIVGPAIGVFILVYIGRKALIFTSIFVFLISLIPLLKVDDFSDRPNSPRWGLTKFFQSEQDRRNYISIMLYGVHVAVEYIIWPLFIYITLGSVRSIALVPIIISVTTILFTVFVNRNITQFRSIMITVGSLLLAFVWVFRLFIYTELVIYFSIFVAGLFMMLIALPLDADIFDRALKTDALSATFYRNTASMAGKLIMFAFLALLVSVFQVSFIVASISLIALSAFNAIFVIRQKGLWGRKIKMKPHYNLQEN